MSVSGAIRAGGAYVELYANDGALVRGLASARNRVDSFAADVTRIGAGMLGLGTSIVGGFFPAVAAASEMEETMNKFNVVFGDSAQTVKAWSDDYASSIGRSKQETADFIAGLQDLFVPLGFASDKAEELSKTTLKLAYDLASFNNKRDVDTYRDLQAALTGSGEVMKKYGVVVSETAVKQELLNQGLDLKTISEQDKVMARLNIILRGTTAAQGDAINSASGFANTFKRLTGTIQDLSVEIGTHLLPVVTPIVRAMGDAAIAASRWVAENRQAVLNIAAIGVGLVGLGATFIAAGTMFSVAASGIGMVVSTVGAVGGAVGGLIALLGGGVPGTIAVGIGAIVASLVAMDEEVQSQLGTIPGKIQDAMAGIENVASSIADAIAIGEWDLAFNIAWESFKHYGIKAIFVLADVLKTSFDAALTGVWNIFESIKNWPNDIFAPGRALLTFYEDSVSAVEQANLQLHNTMIESGAELQRLYTQLDQAKMDERRKADIAARRREREKWEDEHGAELYQKAREQWRKDFAAQGREIPTYMLEKYDPIKPKPPEPIKPEVLKSAVMGGFVGVGNTFTPFFTEAKKQTDLQKKMVKSLESIEKNTASDSSLVYG